LLPTQDEAPVYRQLNRAQRAERGLDQREKFNKMNSESLLKVMALVAGVMFNHYLWPSQNVNCQYNFTWFNEMFLISVLLPEALVRISCLFFW